MRLARLWGLVLLAALACGKRPTADRARDTMPDTTHMRMRAPSLIAEMRTHLDSMAIASPGRLGAMMGRHRSLADQVLDAMVVDARAMGLETDSAWRQLADSVRRDLGELPRLSGTALAESLTAHADRMERLVARYEATMRK